LFSTGRRRSCAAWAGIHRALDFAERGSPDLRGEARRTITSAARARAEWARPDRRWQDASRDVLLEAAEEANRMTDAIDARRSRKIIVAVSMVLTASIVWWIVRRLTGR